MELLMWDEVFMRTLADATLGIVQHAVLLFAAIMGT
jgi:hypothetical protein